jgi:hypothetical protein
VFLVQPSRFPACSNSHMGHGIAAQLAAVSDRTHTTISHLFNTDFRKALTVTEI